MVIGLIYDNDTEGWDELHVARPEQYKDNPGLDRYEVAPGDAVPGMSGERAEGKAWTDGDPGDRQRWTWVTRLPVDTFFPNPRTKWNFPAQWHAASSSLQAPIALLIDTYRAPKWQMRVWPGLERYYDLGPMEKGINLNWQFDIGFSAGGSGFIRVFLDDALVAEDFGPNCYAGDSGVYFKQGFYRGPSDLTTVIRHGHARCVSF